MSVRVSPLLVGALAALRAPLWINRGARFRSLLEPEPSRAERLRTMRDADVQRAVDASSATLCVLARGRVAWKNTCLFRSVAHCLVLRAFGREARVRIGVAPGAAGESGDARAHAWVVTPSAIVVAAPADGFEPLQFTEARES